MFFLSGKEIGDLIIAEAFAFQLGKIFVPNPLCSDGPLTEISLNQVDLAEVGHYKFQRREGGGGSVDFGGYSASRILIAGNS
jgi:hypothetical protein